MTAPNPKPLPSLSFLHNRLDYDPATGAMTHRHNPKRGARVKGKSALYSPPNIPGFSIFMGRNNGGYFRAARVAWKMYHGADPQGAIVHLNFDSYDNRIENLADMPLEQVRHRRA